MAADPNSALYKTFIKIRANPSFARIEKHLPPDVSETFQNVLGEQNKKFNEASGFMNLRKKFSFFQDENFAPTETNIMGDFSRAGAGVRAAMQADVPMDQQAEIERMYRAGEIGGAQAVQMTQALRASEGGSALMRGINRPREVPHYGTHGNERGVFMDAMAKRESTLPPWVERGLHTAAGIGGSALDIASDPMVWAGDAVVQAGINRFGPAIAKSGFGKFFTKQRTPFWKAKPAASEALTPTPSAMTKPPISPAEAVGGQVGPRQLAGPAQPKLLPPPEPSTPMGYRGLIQDGPGGQLELGFGKYKGQLAGDAPAVPLYNKVPPKAPAGNGYPGKQPVQMEMPFSREQQMELDFSPWARSAVPEGSPPAPQPRPNIARQMEMPLQTNDEIAYAKWLEANRPQYPGAPDSVPLHPSVEGKAAAEAYNYGRNTTVGPNGQIEMISGRGRQGPEIFNVPKAKGKVASPVQKARAAAQAPRQMEMPIPKDDPQMRLDFSPWNKSMIEEQAAANAAKAAKRKAINAARAEKTGKPVKDNRPPWDRNPTVGEQMGFEDIIPSPITGEAPKKPVATIPNEVDRAAAEAKIAAMREKNRAPAVEPVAPPSGKKTPSVLSLLKEGQEKFKDPLAQMVINFNKLPGPKNADDLANRVAWKAELKARAKARGQDIKLNRKGELELAFPDPQMKAEASKLRATGGKAKKPVAKKPVAKKPVAKQTPLEEGIETGKASDAEVAGVEALKKWTRGEKPATKKPAAKKQLTVGPKVSEEELMAESIAKQKAGSAIIAKKRKADFQAARAAEERASLINGKQSGAAYKFKKGEMYQVGKEDPVKFVGYDELEGTYDFQSPKGNVFKNNPEDHGAFLSNLKPRPKGKGLRSNRGSADFIPDIKLSAAERAALDKWKKMHGPVLKKAFKKAGRGAAQNIDKWIRNNYPNVSDKELFKIKTALAELTVPKAMIGNMNISHYSPEVQKILKNKFKGHEKEVTTRPLTMNYLQKMADEMTSTPASSAIERYRPGQLAAEQLHRKGVHAAKIRAIAEDPNVSAIDTVEQIIRKTSGNIKKVSTEIGRALAVGRKTIKEQEEAMITFRAVVRKLSEDPNVTKEETKVLLHELGKVLPGLADNATPAEVVKTLLRRSMISGPLTLLANATSGVAGIVGKMTMRGIEISYEKLLASATGNKTTATYREIPALFKGAWKAAAKGRKLRPDLRALPPSDKYGPSPFGYLAESAPSKNWKKAYEGIDFVTKYPESAMRRTDQYIKNIIGMMEKEMAVARGENVFKDLNAIDRILEAQLRSTFQQKLSVPASAIGAVRAQARKQMGNSAGGQVLDVGLYTMQPFIQSVDGIIRQGFKGSILGGLTVPGKALASIGGNKATGKYIGALSKGAMANPKAREELARDLAATTMTVPMFMFTAHQYALGNLVGRLPRDASGRKSAQTAGKMDYSFRWGDRWVPMRLLPEPFATAMQINVAIIQNAHEYAKEKGIEAKNAVEKMQTYYKAWFPILQGVGEMLISKPFMSGMNQFMASVTNRNLEDPSELPAAKKVAGMFVPSSVKDIGVVGNTLAKQPRVMQDNAWDTVRSRLGLRMGMVEELNVFGDPVYHTDRGRVRKEPEYKLLEKFPPPDVARKRSGVKLTQQEYHDLVRDVGKQYKILYKALANNPMFMSLSNGEKRWVLDKLGPAAKRIGSLPRVMQELKTDAAYYNKELRTLLEKKYPGDPGRKTYD